MLTSPPRTIGSERDYNRSGIGFNVSLRAPRANDEPVPSRGNSYSADEPVLDLRITSRPETYGERPHREEIIGAMVNEGYTLPLRRTSEQQVECDTEGNISRVHTTARPEDAAELFVCAKIWARWADDTKNASITLNESVTYRGFFAACLVAIKHDPTALTKVARAMESNEALRQFAGECVWTKWCKDNDPRTHLLRTLVREELSNYRATI